MTTIADVIQWIAANASNEDCKAISRAISHRHSALNQAKMTKFAPGDRVTFIGRHGIQWSGNVKKVNQKTISVTCNIPHRQEWRVPPSLLNHVIGANNA